MSEVPEIYPPIFSAIFVAVSLILNLIGQFALTYRQRRKLNQQQTGAISSHTNDVQILSSVGGAGTTVLVVYEILVGQTILVAILCLLASFSTLCFAIVRLGVMKNDLPPRGSPLSAPQFALGIFAILGTIAGYSMIAGVITGIVDYYI